MVVAQLVRAPDCGSGGRRFETDLPPKKTKPSRNRGLFLYKKGVSRLYTRVIDKADAKNLGSFMEAHIYKKSKISPDTKHVKMG